MKIKKETESTCRENPFQGSEQEQRGYAGPQPYEPETFRKKKTAAQLLLQRVMIDDRVGVRPCLPTALITGKQPKQLY